MTGRETYPEGVFLVQLAYLKAPPLLIGRPSVDWRGYPRLHLLPDTVGCRTFG